MNLSETRRRIAVATAAATVAAIAVIAPTAAAAPEGPLVPGPHSKMIKRYSSSPVLSANGNLLAYGTVSDPKDSSAVPDQIKVLNRATGKTKTVAAKAHGYGFDLSANGKRLAFLRYLDSGYFGAYVKNFKTGKTKRIPTPKGCSPIFIKYAETTAIYSCQMGGKIYYTRGQNTPVYLSQPGVNPTDDFGISDDGNTVLYHDPSAPDACADDEELNCFITLKNLATGDTSRWHTPWDPEWNEYEGLDDINLSGDGTHVAVTYGGQYLAVLVPDGEVLTPIRVVEMDGFLGNSGIGEDVAISTDGRMAAAFGNVMDESHWLMLDTLHGTTTTRSVCEGIGDSARHRNFEVTTTEAIWACGETYGAVGTTFLYRAPLTEETG